MHHAKPNPPEPLLKAAVAAAALASSATVRKHAYKTQQTPDKQARAKQRYVFYVPNMNMQERK
jgi:hypothetical protein